MTHLLTEPLFGDLGVTYALRLLVGKRVVDFLFATTEHFSLSLNNNIKIYYILLANV